MMLIDHASTGLKGLDHVLNSLKKGDNVVLQVDDIESYLHFITPFVNKAVQDGKKVIYIRFAGHPELVPNDKVKKYSLDAKSGFESFSKQIHSIITNEGEGAYYVFDCLSDLLYAWATDLMIGNFFLVTCPYLFKLNTVAYFAILRDNHSFKTIARIRETTQLLLDIYNYEGSCYVHPLKVWNRYSPTMFLPHLEEGEKFIPITNSVDASKLFTYISSKWGENTRRNLDYWDRLFIKAEEALKKTTAEKEEMVKQLNAVMIGREQKMLALTKQNFMLEDLLEIKSRMVGTGFIGGKAVGMLLARKILSNDKSNDWDSLLEPHDSFYIGSDVFYTYIVENGWWDLWIEQKSGDGYFEKAAELKQKLLTGVFPDEIKEQFHQLIEYFGQSPIIARSSSLLEDSFGSAFAGKYESIFCVNQGSPDVRYGQFENTVKQIFASTMDEEALNYRMQRGLSGQDEQMAILVQRVSGSRRKRFFFPFLGGVGVSYNAFVWNKGMDPRAGMMRLVLGLGTRAVNRVEGDYPRIVALDKPLLVPYAGMENMKKYSQHDIDALNISENALQTVPLSDLVGKRPDPDILMVGEKDAGCEPGQSFVLTFNKLLSQTDFTASMGKMLIILEKAYRHPVDIEFTANYSHENELKINLLQCRPLQAKGPAKHVEIAQNIPKQNILFASNGNFMGGNVSIPISRIVYVDPKAYLDLLMSKKYSVARLIGKINRLANKKQMPTILLGPGRWGTRDASLGIPVSFAEINNFSALIEVSDPENGFTPELSFGSHFFLDLVEAQIFYAALFPEEKGVYFDKKRLAKLPNILNELLPDEAAFAPAVKVFDFTDKKLVLLSDIAAQKTVCLTKNTKM